MSVRPDPGRTLAVVGAETLLVLVAFTTPLTTRVAQVHDDWMTTPSDVQTIYDNIPASDKKLHWIEGTDRRFDGYNYFGEHPEPMLEWFDTHMK